ESGVDRGLLREPLPQLDVRGTPAIRARSATSVRARRELELLALELHDPRRGPLEDREAAARYAPAAEGARAARSAAHRGIGDVRDPGARAAHVQRRATQLLRRPADHAVLRGRDVLEHAVG